MNNESQILEVDRLEAGYGNVLIARGISVRLERGEIVTIIGPNGSGKSTLIKSIFGLTKIEGGRIRLNGRDVTNASTSEMVRMGLGYVPQAANIFPNMSVRENVEMGAFSLHGDINARLQEMRELFPVLDDRWDALAGHLSGGQRQMLALARALITDPNVLLLDEPTAGLAPQIVDSVLSQISEINRGGVSILLVEQNAVKALRISNRAYVLARGQNYFEDSAQDLLNNPDIGRVFLGLGGAESDDEAEAA